jgi:hypothetical protein
VWQDQLARQVMPVQQVQQAQLVPKDRVAGKEAKMSRSLMMSAEQLGLSAQEAL